MSTNSTQFNHNVVVDGTVEIKPLRTLASDIKEYEERAKAAKVSPIPAVLVTAKPIPPNNSLSQQSSPVSASSPVVNKSVSNVQQSSMPVFQPKVVVNAAVVATPNPTPTQKPEVQKMPATSKPIQIETPIHNISLPKKEDSQSTLNSLGLGDMVKKTMNAQPNQSSVVLQKNVPNAAQNPVVKTPSPIFQAPPIPSVQPQAQKPQNPPKADDWKNLFTPTPPTGGAVAKHPPQQPQDSLHRAQPVVHAPVVKKITPVTVAEPEEDIVVVEARLIAVEKEQEVLSKKLEVISKNKNRLESEEAGLLKKKFDITTVLNPLVEEQKSIDKKIQQTEEDEAKAKEYNLKRKVEEERWAEEDRRKDLEQQIWSAKEDLEANNKLLVQVEIAHKNVLKEEAEALGSFNALTLEKDRKKVQVKIHDMRELEKDVAAAEGKVSLELKKAEEMLKDILKREGDITFKKKDIEKRELASTNLVEQKALATERWGVEGVLRDTEKERWKIENKQAELSQSLQTLSRNLADLKQQEDELHQKLHGMKKA